MENKDGYSKEKKSWLGEKYTQHYDSRGKETGISKRETNWLGEKRIQHYETKNKEREENFNSYSGYDNYENSNPTRHTQSFMREDSSTLYFIGLFIAWVGIISYSLGMLGLVSADDLSGILKLSNSSMSIVMMLAFVIGALGLFFVICMTGVGGVLCLGLLLAMIVTMGKGGIPILEVSLSLKFIVAGIVIFIISIFCLLKP